MWQLDFKITYKYITYIEEFLNFISDSVSFSTTESKNIEIDIDEIWQVSLYFELEPNFTAIIKQLSKLASMHNFEIIELSYNKLAALDWVSIVQEKFKPLHVGRFFISSKFYAHYAAKQQIPIIIDAAGAFGTGEHATTKSCIESLEYLADHKFDHILDMGTGSGILAIGASHIWPDAIIYGCDIDEVAIPIAIDNANFNSNRTVNFFQSDGYNNKIFTELNFGLIIINILATPLINLAADTAIKCCPDGFVVLSGFLQDQADIVIAAYQAQDFRLIKIIMADYLNDTADNQWVTLIMQR